MYSFVFLWTMALSPNKEAIKHGLIFVNFMTACMAGSFLSSVSGAGEGPGVWGGGGRGECSREEPVEREWRSVGIPVCVWGGECSMEVLAREEVTCGWSWHVGRGEGECSMEGPSRGVPRGGGVQ